MEVFIACSQTSGGFHTTGHIPCWHQWYVSECPLHAILIKHSSGQVCRWSIETITSLHLLSVHVCVTTCHSQRSIALLLWLVEGARFGFTCQSDQQPQLQHTCRPACIPNSCAQIAPEALPFTYRDRPGDLALCRSSTGKCPEPPL